jgi:hypothetical protein
MKINTLKNQKSGRLANQNRGNKRSLKRNVIKRIPPLFKLLDLRNPHPLYLARFLNLLNSTKLQRTAKYCSQNRQAKLVVEV